MSTVLITGGAGMIGSNLAIKLLSEGTSVTILDDFTSGVEENIEDIKKMYPDLVTFINHDVLQPLPADLPSSITQVYHLACPASPPKYQADPIRTWKINLIGTMNVAEWCLANTARIMFSSTSEVYGDPQEHPQKETYRGNTSCTGIRACYDEGKRAAETVLFDYHRAHGLQIRIARIFNTYGPRMAADDGRVITNFVLQSLANQDITVYGDGTQTRSFCYVDDTVRGLVALMNGDYIGPVNVGNPHERTIVETAKIIQRLVGGSGKLVHGPLPSDDPLKRCPDIALAKQHLKWEPTTDFESGLKVTIAHFKKIHERQASK